MKWLLVVLMMVGCSHDVRARYPPQPDLPTGTLILTMSEPADGVSVAVNGVLVVDDVHTKHIQIDGVPTGTGEVIMAANGADKAFHVWIDSDRPTTVPLGVPSEGSSFLKTLFGSLVTLVAYSLLH